MHSNKKGFLSKGAVRPDDIICLQSAGEDIRMRVLRFLNEEEMEAQVEILSGPHKGKITILRKCQD